MTEPINNTYKLITNSGGESHTYAEWSKITGLDKNLIIDRITRQNWDVDRALYTPLRNHIKEITYNGYTYNLSDWAIALGYSGQSVIGSRLKKGWSEKDALFGKADRHSGPIGKLPNAIFFVDDESKPIQDENG